MDRVLAELAAGAMPLLELSRAASQIIVFGSRAAGVASPSSDLDILCVGKGQSSSGRALDLVWIDEGTLASAGWLQSELAGHVAFYGRWLRGSPDWKSQVKCGQLAAERKALRIASRIRAMERGWGLLSGRQREEHCTLLRRDLQRHALLARGQPVPPGPVLDRAWRTHDAPLAELLSLAERVGGLPAFLEVIAARSWPRLRRGLALSPTHGRPSEGARLNVLAAHR
jgi:hypothetical protein